MSSFKDDRKSFLINFKLDSNLSYGNEDISLNNTCIFSNVTLATCQCCVQWLTELSQLDNMVKYQIIKSTRTYFGWLRPCLLVYKRISFYCAR